MATGTGKTRTALSIMVELLERGLARTFIVVAYGTDLLDQWHRELVRRTSLPIFRTYERHHESQSFLNDPEHSILLVSRQALPEILPRLRATAYQHGMIV